MGQSEECGIWFPLRMEGERVVPQKDPGLSPCPNLCHMGSLGGLEGGMVTEGRMGTE